MKIKSSVSAGLALFLLSAATAHASSSEWHHADGASVRLVTSGMPDKQGKLRGALEIRLKPGWKTYWRDPGASGVPPTLEIAADQGVNGIELGFPAPQRFDDGYSVWAGYDHSVALAVTLAVDGPEGPARFDASAFIGICETICVPVQASFSVDPATDAYNPEHAALAAAAFAALPGEAGPDFRAEIVEAGADGIVVEATLPKGSKTADLFVAGTEAITFGTPERLGDDGSVRFNVPVIDRDETGAEAEAFYTLVTAAGAVAGKLRLR